MTQQNLYDTLKLHLQLVISENRLNASEMAITAKTISAEEAIGQTTHKNFSLHAGEEIILTAEYCGTIGQASTHAPFTFNGTVEEILAMDLVQDACARSLFLAALNAVMGHLKLSANSIHCKNAGPEICARHMVKWIAKNYGSPRIALVGFQPALLHTLSRYYEIQVLDLNPNNIGTVQCGCKIYDGITDRRKVVEWSSLVLCTDSALSNGTIVYFMDLKKPVVYFGITLSGAAPLLNIPHVCFTDQCVSEEPTVRI